MQAQSNVQVHQNVKHSLLDQIKQDHNEAKSFFSEYQRFRERADFHEAKKWFNQWSWAIARHSIAEEVVVYPALSKKLPKYKIEDLLSDHQEVKENLSKLEKLPVEEREFDRIMIATQNSLVEHMSKEELEEIPEFERVSSQDDIEQIVRQFERRKAIVPTRAHPNAPTNPYLESLVGLFTAPMDKIKDIFSDFPEKEAVSKASKKDHVY